jgi:thymidylate kinase
VTRETRAETLAPLVESVERRPPPARRPGPGIIVALSGMDGAGKSSAAGAIALRLREAGYPVKHQWHRLGEMDALDRVAAPVRWLARPRRPIAGSVVRGMRPARGPVAWTWVLVVALETVRSYLLSIGLTRWGLGVVCDRWTTDSLVELELRYGRHRLAEWLLRRAAPRADLEILLEIDAASAARRKPDDQPRPVLERMQQLYGRAARAPGVRTIDATRPLEDVLEDVLALVDEVITARGAASGRAARQLS